MNSKTTKRGLERKRARYADITKLPIAVGEAIHRTPPGVSALVPATSRQHTYALMREAQNYSVRTGVKVSTEQVICLGTKTHEVSYAVRVTVRDEGSAPEDHAEPQT